MFDCKIKFESNEVLKNELFASIVPGEATCNLSNVNDLNLARVIIPNLVSVIPIRLISLIWM